MLSYIPKASKNDSNYEGFRRLVLEFLEDRSAPGDLLGLGLTQAAMAPAGSRVLGNINTATTARTVAPNTTYSVLIPAGNSTQNASSSPPSQSALGLASLPRLSPNGPLFSFPQQPVEGFPEYRSASAPSTPAVPADYSILGGFPTPIGMPNFGTPAGISPPRDGSPTGSPVSPSPVITPPPSGTTAVSFTGISPDTGTSQTDAITSNQRPTVFGTATPGSLVSISENGSILGTGMANIAGAFSVPIFQALSNGAHQLSIKAVKAGMDTGTAMGSVTIDTVPPQVSLKVPASIVNGATPEVMAISSEGGMISIDVDLNMDGQYTGSELAYANALSGRQLTLQGLNIQGTTKIRARQSDIAGNVGFAEASTTIDRYAGFIGDSQLKAMLQPVLRELGYTGKWDGKAVSVPTSYTPSDPKLAEMVTISTRCVSPRQFDAFQSAVAQLGMNIVATNNRDLLVDGRIPLYKILNLPGVDGFSTATFVPKAMTRSGSVQNQGVPVMGIPQFIQKTGANGSGITIGVISDSANAVAPGVTGSINSGDLPGNTTILSDDPAGSDEGRAMMEVAYDAAPGSAMAFSAGGSTPQTFANSIYNLANFGCRVITDDLVFFTQPLFNDGRVSQAAQTVSDNGVVYTSAFGNDQDWGWQANWAATTGTVGLGVNSVTGTFMNLGRGDYLQNLTIPTGGSFTLAFQWDAAYLEGGSTLPNYQVPNNLDAYLIDLTTGQIVASSTSINQNTDQACEIFSYQNASTNTSFAMAFQLVSGPAPTRLAWINYGNVDVQAQGQGATTSQGTATAPGVIAVAAASAKTPSIPESFTSLGGALPFYFDTFTGARLSTPQIRQKPDITAPDGVSTTLSPNSGLNPFFGTSCAAPQVAAASALLLSSRPTATNNQVFFQLISTASKIYPAGLEDYVGAGMTTVVPFPSTLPPDPSGDPLFPTMIGTVGQNSIVLRNESIANIGNTPDVDWYAFRPAINGTINVSMLNGPGGSLEMRLYTLGSYLNMVERARSNNQGLTYRNLAITVSANQLVYIKVNGRTSSAGVVDQAMYQLTLKMS